MSCTYSDPAPAKTPRVLHDIVLFVAIAVIAAPLFLLALA